MVFAPFNLWEIRALFLVSSFALDRRYRPTASLKPGASERTKELANASPAADAANRRLELCLFASHSCNQWLRREET